MPEPSLRTKEDWEFLAEGSYLKKTIKVPGCVLIGEGCPGLKEFWENKLFQHPKARAFLYKPSPTIFGLVIDGNGDFKDTYIADKVHTGNYYAIREEGWGAIFKPQPQWKEIRAKMETPDPYVYIGTGSQTLVDVWGNWVGRLRDDKTVELCNIPIGKNAHYVVNIKIWRAHVEGYTSPTSPGSIENRMKELKQFGEVMTPYWKEPVKLVSMTPYLAKDDLPTGIYYLSFEETKKIKEVRKNVLLVQIKHPDGQYVWTDSSNVQSFVSKACVVTVGGIDYKAVDDGNCVTFGCATISKSTLSDAYKFMRSQREDPTSSHKQIEAIKIGKGLFTWEHLKTLNKYYGI
jgi:hypothetical protein